MRRALRRLSRVVGHDEAKEALNLVNRPLKKSSGALFRGPSSHFHLDFRSIAL